MFPTIVIQNVKDLETYLDQGIWRDAVTTPGYTGLQNLINPITGTVILPIVHMVYRLVAYL